jgi:hypothetical protein
MKHFVWILSITLFACSSEVNLKQEQIELKETILEKDTIEVNELDSIPEEVSKTEKRLENSKQLEFLSFYKKFTQAILQSDLDAINKCIHSDGLYFIESNGAMPLIQKVFDVKAYSKTSKPTTFFNLGFDDIEKQPLLDILPKVICDEDVFDKNGCFLQEVNPLLKSQIWNYAGLNEKEIQAIDILAKTIKMTVVNTSNYTYYFSEIGGEWYFTFLDLRIPCTA